MDAAERIKKLYDRLPVGSAFRRVIEQTLARAEDLTGLPLTTQETSDDEPDDTDPGSKTEV